MLNLTVLEDEFRVATIGRLASCALGGRKYRRRPNTAVSTAL
jgi:hypothetical protein